ncbi:hypothetical protein CR513_23188, partial [Mucuna pruriens]
MEVGLVLVVAVVVHEASVCYHHFEENYVSVVPLDFMAMQWYSTPWNTYHYQPHDFPTHNNQYVRPIPSYFVLSKSSHLTTPTSPHVMMATVDPYYSVNHWYPDLVSHTTLNNRFPLKDRIKLLLVMDKASTFNLQELPNFCLLLTVGSQICPPYSKESSFFSVPFVVHNPLIHTTIVLSLSFSTWYFRLGHRSVDAQHIVFKHCNFPPLNKNVNDFSSSCCLGKAHWLPSTIFTTIYNKSLELIYSDLWGHTPLTSVEGFTYYVTFVDACTCFTWLYLLKSNIWGGEYWAFTNYLAQYGIMHRIIHPHTHHQNGVVERKHHHVQLVSLYLLVLHYLQRNMGLCTA